MTSPGRDDPRFARSDSLPAMLPGAAVAALAARAGELTLVLSADGDILDIAATDPELAAPGWIGAAWVDTVTVESRPKVEEMLADARSGTSPRWRQVNHPVPGGEVPIRYMVTDLGADGRLIAVGRDLREMAAAQQRLLQTQQSLERDYIRLRQAETRYRLLFETASEPVVIVDADSRRIREANPAAHHLLGLAEGTLIGAPANRLVDEDDREAFIAFLGGAEVADDREPVTLRAGKAGPVQFVARLFRQGRTPSLLIRLLPPGGYASAGSADETALAEVVERMPDAFVLVDRDLNVLTANAAFVGLAGVASVDRIVGQRLDGWFGRAGIDLDLIVAQLREHGVVRNVQTIVRDAAGGQEEVEASAVAAPTGNGDCYGFTIRSVARRLRDTPAVTRELPRSVDQLTELVGRMSLKEIVRESTDLIERLCIEAALAYTSDNRASAAEILGVSRQSLYSKLHRHGLGNLVGGED